MVPVDAAGGVVVVGFLYGLTGRLMELVEALGFKISP